MSTRAGIYKEYKRNFLIDEGKLRKIANVLKTHADKLAENTFTKFRVNWEDDSFYETSEIDEVLADDNTPGRSIKLIGIELHKAEESAEDAISTEPDRKKALAIVLFDRFGTDEKVNLIVQHRDRDWCFLLSDELDAQIQRMLKKSPFLGSFPPLLVDPIVFFSLGAIALLYLVFLGTKLSPVLTPDQIAAMSVEDRTAKLLEFAVKKHTRADWIMPLTWVVMAIVFGFLGLRPISRLLQKSSRSVFYWGDMVPIHDAFEKRIARIKWGVLIAFAVSLVASLIGGVILR